MNGSQYSQGLNKPITRKATLKKKKKGKKRKAAPGRTFGAERTRPANYGRRDSLDLGRGPNMNGQNLHRCSEESK